MVSFFLSFSDSLLLALLAWPFIAYALTIPVMILQYRKYNRIVVRRVVGYYFFMLYALALVSFTLYPMPDNPTVFCQDYNLSPQLIPFTFIGDIASDGLRAVLQVLMNIAFFVPLGFFARMLFNWRFGTTIIISLAVSLFIETAQLTGGFGIYPCSYRLFDVDDLLLNTLGGVLGYSIARLFPKRYVEQVSKGDVVRKPGLARHIVAFLLDQFVAQIVGVFIFFGFLLLLDIETATNIRGIVSFFVSVIIIGVVPYLARGTSIGGLFVRLNYDDKPRSLWRRTFYYLVRGAVLMLILFPPFSSSIGFITGLVVLIYWWRRKQLPWQAI